MERFAPWADPEETVNAEGDEVVSWKSNHDSEFQLQMRRCADGSRRYTLLKDSTGFSHELKSARMSGVFLAQDMAETIICGGLTVGQLRESAV